VYASFPSPQLVPRDVVFGKFSSVGGVKESWIATLYILTADFADILLADEDQMQPDGNPHPLPGHVLQNHNLFANPLFPEVGWDAVQQEPDLGQHGGGNMPNEGQNEHEDMEEEGQEAPESMILNLSDSSSFSVNMMEFNGANQQMQGTAHNVLHVGVVTLFIGPPPPPDMQRKRFLNYVIPSLYVQLVKEKVPYLYFDRLSNVSTDIWGKSISSGLCVVKGGDNVVICDEITLSQDNVLTSAGPSALEGNISVVTPMGRRKKRTVPLLQSLERRFTRSC
jgi:hypothetical protein